MRWAALFLVFATSACGGAAVQQAQIDRGLPDGAAPSVAPAEVELPASGARYVVVPEHTRFEIHAWAPVVGEQVLTFKRFRANVAADRTTASFRADVDVRTLEGGAPGVAALARSQALEVDRFPRATFVGSASLTPGSEDCTVSGTLTLHGVTRALTFSGRVHEEGDALRFRATFDMPRKAFGVRLHDPLDAFVGDDVRVELDLLADREHVQVEEL